MGLEIRKLRKQDEQRAIQFAITGMRFNWYLDSPQLLRLYGRYFWYLEMNRATHVLAAYQDDEFAGVLLAEMKGEEKRFHSFWKALYVKTFNVLQNLFVKDGPGAYDRANQEMFARYCEQNAPDGEIVFLAANPELKIKGVGSHLLNELERREAGKRVFLYTDNACTYQFYEYRGFERAGEKDVKLQIGSKVIDLQCFLYSKVLG